MMIIMRTDATKGQIAAVVERVEKKELLVINLDEMGIDKLLGSGRIKRQLTVKVKFHSQLAAKKIEEAKGKIVNIDNNNSLH